MRLKVKKLFIGLEFKIEQEADIPQKLLFDRITQELEALDDEVAEIPPEKILFNERNDDQSVST